MSCIYDTNKIDFMRYDKWKRKIILTILDINVWNNEKEIQEHFESAKRKIELYVNYILDGSALEYFKLSDDKKYSYIIDFICEPMDAPVAYANMLEDVANQIHQNYGNMITLKSPFVKQKKWKLPFLDKIKKE